MAFKACLQCGQKKRRTRDGFLVQCKQGATHYSPKICQECFNVFEGMLEAVTGSKDSHSHYQQLELPPLR